MHRHPEPFGQVLGHDQGRAALAQRHDRGVVVDRQAVAVLLDDAAPTRAGQAMHRRAQPGADKRCYPLDRHRRSRIRLL